MDEGTYSAASGGLVQLKKLDIVSNNLANVSTAGFKKQMLANEEQKFEDTFAALVESKDPYARPDHDRYAGVVNYKEVTDFSAGPIVQTNSLLDAALKNENDFFVVQTPEGVRYTRAGNFSLSSEGKLVTADGMTVMGDGGEITAQGAGARINPDGSVQTQDGVVGRIQVMRFEDPNNSLLPVGGARYQLGQSVKQPQQVEADVLNGSLEMANVSSVGSMIDLITVSRAFELYTKTAQSIDEMNQQAISRYGSRR